MSDLEFFKNPVEPCPSNSKSKIGYAYHPDMELHKDKNDHCERPERTRSIDYQLNKSKLKSYLNHITVDEADENIAQYVHNEKYTEKFK